MLPGLVNRILGRSTRSGAVFSPYSVEPYPLPQIDIYNFIRREDEQSQTRQLDQDLTELEPLPSDPDYAPCHDIDLNLGFDLYPPAPPLPLRTPRAKNAPHPPPPPTIRLPHLGEPIQPDSTIRVPRLGPASMPALTSSTPHIEPLTPTPTILPLIRARHPQHVENTRAKKKKYQRAHRLEKRQAQQHISGNPAKQVVARRVQQSTPIFTALDISDLDTTSTVWLGVRLAIPDLRTYTVNELRALGMTFLNGDGRACRPLIDVKQRVFACLAGRPRPTQGNDTYDAAVCAATQLCETEGAQATGDGRRGDFVAVSAGVSFGGGQRRPGVLLNSRTNAVICAALVAHWSFQCITHFGNGIFRVFAPALHKFYKEQMSVLHAAAPHLRRLFPEALSVFAACTFNFGPSTVTFPHVDAANLAWGWCSITALGNFNPDLGGHLILWDLNLVIRFPPGSTIMIPSALLRHSNIAIQQGEKQYSFTQFTAGGLFRWVNNGHRCDKEFFARATAEELQAREDARAQRWEDGVRMFKVWDVAL